LTESIALDYTVKINFCRTHSTGGIFLEKRKQAANDRGLLLKLRPVTCEKSGAAFEVGASDGSEGGCGNDESCVADVGGGHD
jgi:hypothetical protein